jgi:pyrophosphatase PpaX
MKPLSAVMFDVDGTLLDTRDFVMKAYDYTLDYVSAQPDKALRDDLLKKLFGKPLTECYEVLVPGGDIVQLCRIHDEFQNNNLSMVLPFPNVARTIAHFKGRGVKVAAVTNRYRSSTETILEVQGLDVMMDYVIGFEDVANPKPHPEMLHKTLTYFGVEPDEAVMVGDSEWDIQAGRNAGTRTVGVRTGFHPEVMERENPDFVFDDMFEMTRHL